MRSATRGGSWWQRCIECSDDAALAAHAQAMRDYTSMQARDVRAGDMTPAFPASGPPAPFDRRHPPSNFLPPLSHFSRTDFRTF